MYSVSYDKGIRLIRVIIKEQCETEDQTTNHETIEVENKERYRCDRKREKRFLILERLAGAKGR